MDGTGKPTVVHCCSCSRCRSQPDGPTAKQHHALNDLVATLDEKSRRLVVGLLAKQHGRGGIARFARITGLSRDTIRRGQRELAHPDQRAVGRIRRPGGGRQRVEKKCPHILVALEDLLRDAVAGDPMSGVRWTHKSIRKLCAAQAQRGLPLGHGTLARLLKEQRYSLRTNRKRLARPGDPDRARHSPYLARLPRSYLTPD